MCCMRTEVAMQHGLHFINKTCILVAWASNFSGYATDGLAITSERCIKDLGVYLSTNINFIHHYEKIITGAYKILGLLRQTFTPCICHTHTHNAKK